MGYVPPAAADQRYISAVGGTMTGELVLPGTPSDPLAAAPRQYVDDRMRRYEHIQATLATVWTVNHNLGAHPSVSVEDAAGTVVYGTVQYLDINTLTVSFGRTCTGRVNCI